MQGTTPAGDRIQFSPDYPGFLITDVNVKGKFMYWTLANDWFVWSTYGMTGQWVISTSGTSPKHTSFTFYLSSSDDIESMTVTSAVHFRDPRHFGTVKFSRGQEALDAKLATLGPDMLSDPPSHELFRERIRFRSTKTLAEAVMDQYVISGVGNYIRSEALWLARISPWRLIDSLKDEEIETLRLSIVDIMSRSYAAGGTSFSTYKNVDGSLGNFQNKLQVYGRSLDSFGNVVIKEKDTNDRTVHWVPLLQT